MNRLVDKFRKLKTSVGGNREKTEYEETNFVTPEEKFLITEPGRWQYRILGELEFALKLAHKNPAWYGCADTALDGLQAALDRQGAITMEDALAAESALRPLMAEAKDYKLILIGHAHIDMNWMWSWQETVTATLETFRTMLSIMEDYPGFRFSQSQAAVYKIVEDYEPEMMDEIKRRIREGRWEITASAWVETDKNMPSAESLARHMLYTKKYMEDTWGVDPSALDIDFSPDTFGHSAFLPEINAHGGVKYYYHCRGLDGDDTLFRWRAPSGAEMLVYREPYWYNGSIGTHIGAGIVDLADRCAGLKTGLIVYGIGDHGGGPTRRDIERAMEMGTWPIYPEIRFGSLREYFKLAETVRPQLKVVDHELNYIFPGCYTTQSRLKLGNRKSEALLGEAEAFGALAGRGGAGRYVQAWRNVLFTHFHDILTGSCVRDSREHAMGLFSEAQAVANTGRAAALRAIAARTDTSMFASAAAPTFQSDGAGAGYVSSAGIAPSAERGLGITRVFQVFNPSPLPRRCLAELTVWDWDGDMKRIRFRDAEGAVAAHQMLDAAQQIYWDHRYFRVLLDVNLPALGYGTWAMDEAPVDEYRMYYHPNRRTQRPFDNYVLENEYIRAEFDRMSAGLISLVDKETGEERIRRGDEAGLRLVDTEPRTSSAWNIGRYVRMEKLDGTIEVAPRLEPGALRQSLDVEIPFRNSTAKLSISLDRGSQAVAVHMTVDWNEISREKQHVPALIYAMPLEGHTDGYLYDVPGGALKRPAMNADAPGLQYGAAILGGRALALVTDCKYGYRGDGGMLAATLIHAPHHPDPDPERGLHEINLSVLAAPACPTELEERAFALNHPPVFLPVRPHGGELPPAASLMELEAGTTAVVSAVKPAEDGMGTVVRLYNVSEEATVARLLFRRAPVSAESVDVLENPADGEAGIAGNAVEVRLGGCRLAAVRIRF